jgi:hypothetical protein
LPLGFFNKAMGHAQGAKLTKGCLTASRSKFWAFLFSFRPQAPLLCRCDQRRSLKGEAVFSFS